MTLLAVVAGLLLLLVLGSYAMEALRPTPTPPERLAWAPHIPIRYVFVDGVRVRYIVTGQGRPLVLLHTLRTQLDIFQKVIPRLAEEFTVYAMDYPGHGWSDIPRVNYTPDYFARFVTRFLEQLEIRNSILVGVSIGGSIPLLMDGESSSGIRGIVSINPYDYGHRGLARANLVARLIVTLAPIPVVGGTVMRLRNRMLEGKILEGGVYTPSAIPESFREEVFVTGERPGHYQGFLNLIRHMPLWNSARTAYRRVQVPVLLVYGDRDWARPGERERNGRDIPGAQMVLVERGGHFLPLDQPDQVIQAVHEFAGRLP